MNFLDEDEWDDLDQLEKDHQELTEQSVTELHERLKPYFLRRLKIDVLDLPPKVNIQKSLRKKRLTCYRMK